MTESKTKRFEEICSELHDFDKKTHFVYHYESNFRTIALMAQAEEGRGLIEAKKAVACWWDIAKSILTEKDIVMTCLAAFPLHALRVAYDKKMKNKE